MSTDKIKTAELDWSDGASLRSTQFDDVYFSDIGGLEETRHVFLDGNDLDARFSALANRAPCSIFTIGELGFGTGLNILGAWQAWNNRSHTKAHLHLVSVEGFPLTSADFTKAHVFIAAQWPELSELSAKLVAHYPPLMPGPHILHLAEDVTLTLIFGEVASALNQIRAQMDAWFLDGFSPSLNPAMWRETVIDEIARLSADCATLASFTVAGAVRRALGARGFEVKKSPGFGRKRDMLKARKEERAPALSTTTPPATPSTTPWYTPPTPPALKGTKKNIKVAIIGAGIAGASAAWHLNRAGFDVTLYDPGGAAAGASGNPAGLVLPRLDADDNAVANFYKASWLYAIKMIALLEDTSGIKILRSKGARQCGIDATTKARNRRLLRDHALPAELQDFDIDNR